LIVVESICAGSLKSVRVSTPESRLPVMFVQVGAAIEESAMKKTPPVVTA
jgi:hypothetical protein